MTAAGEWALKHDREQRFEIGWEMQQMLQEMYRRRIDVVLEIGTFQGDSLRIWREEFDPELMVGVQDTDETTPETAAELRVRMVRGRSQDVAVYAEVLEVLAGRRLDLLYIDGDHLYDAVKEDWRLYSPLVREGGIVVLHDPVIEDNPTVEVFRFYREVRVGRRTKLIYGGCGSTGTAMGFP